MSRCGFKTASGPSVAEWTYRGPDTGLRLFTLALAAGAPWAVPDGGLVLDVGCGESPWLEWAEATWPTAHFVGVDWRATAGTHGRRVYLKANALNRALFAAGTFDAIVGMSAFEHFGLGHHATDPVDANGDRHIVAHCASWLRPGGYLYFDVPYDPRAYRVEGTAFRVYDAAALEARLRGARWIDHWRGYARTACERLIPAPTTHGTADLEYYVACVWQKPSRRGALRQAAARTAPMTPC